MTAEAPLDPPFLRRTAEGVAVRVRLTPKAARDGVDGAVALAPPEAAALAVRLRARPVEGQANAALVAFLAEILGLPRSAVSLQKGAASRIKTVLLRGDPEALARALAKSAVPRPRHDEAAGASGAGGFVGFKGLGSSARAVTAGRDRPQPRP